MSLVPAFLEPLMRKRIFCCVFWYFFGVDVLNSPGLLLGATPGAVISALSGMGELGVLLCSVPAGTGLTQGTSPVSPQSISSPVGVGRSPSPPKPLLPL